MRLIIILCVYLLAGCSADADVVEAVLQVGHTRPLGHVVFSPDQRYILTSAAGLPGNQIATGEQLILWDASSGDKLRNYSVAMPRLAPRFCLGSRAIAVDGRVLDLASGAILAQHTDAAAQIVSQAVSEDGERVAICTHTTVEILDIATGTRLHAFSIDGFTDRDASLKSVVFRSDGDAIVSVQQQAQASVWQVKNGEKLCEFPAQYADDVFFSPHGRWVCTQHWLDTGSSVIDIRIHDAQTGQFALLVHESLGGSVKFMPDENSCIVGSGTRAASRWDLQSGEKVTSFGGHQQDIVEIELLDNGDVLETRSTDRARRWDSLSGNLQENFLSPFKIDDGNEYHLERQAGINQGVAVKASEDGSLFLAGIVVTDAHSKRRLQTLHPRPSAVGDGPMRLGHRVLSADGSRLIIEYDDPDRRRMAHLRDPRTANILSRLTTDPIGPDDIIWSDQARRAITIGDGYFCLWDVNTGRPLLAQRYKPVHRSTVAFAPGGRFLYSHGQHTRLVLWDAESGELWNPAVSDVGGSSASQSTNLDQWSDHSVVSPDGRVAFSSEAAEATSTHRHKKQWRLWDLRSGEILPAFIQGAGDFHRAFFSADSRYMAIPYHRDRFDVIEMWDLQSETKLYDLELPLDRSRRATVFFLPNEKQILINGGARSLFLADLQSGKLLRTLTDTNLGSHHRIEFLRPDVLTSPDSRWAVANYGTAYTIIWNVKTGDPHQLIREDNGNIDVSSRYHFNREGNLLLARMRNRRIINLETGAEESISDVDIRKLDTSQWSPLLRPSQLRPAVPAGIASRFADKFPAVVTDQQLSPDGTRLIAYHGDASVTLWDVASLEMLSRCYILDRGKAFLPVTADGTIGGNQKFVKYRTPKTIQIVPQR